MYIVVSFHKIKRNTRIKYNEMNVYRCFFLQNQKEYVY